MSAASLSFRIAREPWELEQIHRLNYETFTEEIPQHAPDPSRMRVDRFHDENTYIVCVSGERVVGMVALRRDRPFSVEQKITNFDAYIPPGRQLLEVRLLAVEREHRRSRVLAGLVREIWTFGSEAGCDAAVISATTRQLRLYEHLGFVPFGPLVGSEDARFQPMLVTREAFMRSLGKRHRLAVPAEEADKMSFLTGPVEIHRDVVAAFAEAPLSTRSAEFLGEMNALRESLRRMTSAAHVEVMLGSGTLANDAVAAQIATWGESGLVLVNGEFGERLVDHARRSGLQFDTLRVEWGAAFDLSRIARRLDDTRARWLWMTACETSTSILNDWQGVAAECRMRGVRIALDAVSAVGCVPVDLSRIDLATAVSGKGLGAYPGLAIVFHRDAIARSASIPRYLDVGLWSEAASTPFTHSSNLVRALRVAVDRLEWEARLRERAEIGAWLRARLASLGLKLIGGSAPHVTTIDLGVAYDSAVLAAALARDGFLVAWESAYLRQRNWIQIALMGETTRRSAAALFRAMRALIAAAR